MKFYFLPIFYSVITIFLIVCEISCLPNRNTGEFILVNNSNDLITEAKIDICKQVIKVKNMEMNEKFTGVFKITSDSHYKVVILFASGNTLTSEFGYVTRGFNIKHIISVTDSNITIRETKIE